MSRWLYGRLRSRYGNTVTQENRRTFLKQSLAVGSSMLMSGCSRSAPIKPADRHVLIIGAGFAGMACAYELAVAGCRVTVCDARSRLGGRVLSFGQATGNPWIKDKTVEGGGELIGSIHPLWVAYADKFKLTFDDADDKSGLSPIIVEGRRLSETEESKLWDEIDACLSRLSLLASHVDSDMPWTSPRARRLDQMSLHDWLEDQKDVSPLCRKAIHWQESATNGSPSHKQSLLGVLTMVRGGGLEKYWTESEIYRCAGGNQQLVERFADHIGREHIRLSTPIRTIEQSDDGVTATAENGEKFNADYVVLAVPPTVWTNIDFHPELPSMLQPQMGHALKYLAHVRERYWHGRGLAATSLTDGPVSTTWEGTLHQKPSEDATLHCFSGGTAAQDCMQVASGERDQAYSRWLESIYPGFQSQFVGARFMNWPMEPWVMTGYSFPAPGQVCTIGPVLAALHGRMVYAGEHTCYKFVGYMEGALQSGWRAAKILSTIMD